MQSENSQDSTFCILTDSLRETPKVLPGEHTTFVYQGRIYKVRGSGRRMLKLLGEWKRVVQDEDSSALSLRNQIERVIASAPPMLLTFMLKQTGDAMTVRLLLLLIRRSHAYPATRVVFFRYEDSDPKVRRDVVRTLYRLAAWRELRIVEAKCDFDDTRALVASFKKPAFETRLKNFARVLQPICPESASMELYVNDGVTFSAAPPRSESQIARVLRTIRYLVQRANLRPRFLCHRKRA